MNPLTIADFPLIVVGLAVYRRSESSPMFYAPNATVADDIVMRLNRDHLAQFGGSYQRPEPGTYVGGGLVALPVFYRSDEGSEKP